VLGPAVDAGFEEGAIDDELAAVVEKVAERPLAVRAVERVVLVDGRPRHAAALGGQGVSGAGLGFFFQQELLAGSFPFVGGDDGRRVHAAGGWGGGGHGVMPPVVIPSRLG